MRMKLHDILRAERVRRNLSQGDIASRLIDMGVDISTATLSRIEKGWVPSFPVVKGYCDIFGWTLAELERRMKSNDIEGGPTDTFVRAAGRDIAVLSWVSAGGWGDSPHLSDEECETVFVPGKIPKRAFALRVSGTSMENCKGPHHFPNGSLILVNPDIVPNAGDFVVAMDENTQEATFKQLIEDCGVKYLKPLNSQYPVMKVTPTTVIKGVVFRSIDDKKISISNMK